MKLIFFLLTFCVLGVCIQGYALEKKFIQDNEAILKNLFNLTGNLDDRSTFTATVNDFGDKLLANFDELAKTKNFDPLQMGDIKQGFIFGYLKLSDIHLDGMSSVHRSGDVVMVYNKDSEQLTINIPIRLENVELACGYKAVLFLLGPQGTVTGGVKDIQVMTSILIDFNAYRAMVNKFEITKSGHISVNIHGNPLIDWAVNLVLNAATMMFKGIIEIALDLVIKGSMDDAVEKIDDILSFLRP